jgi:hypothetical protein
MCSRHQHAACRPARALSALRVAPQSARSAPNPEGTSDRIHDDHLSLELSRILHFEPGLHDCHSATEGGLPSALHRRRDQADDRLPANPRGSDGSRPAISATDIMGMIGKYRLASTAADIQALELAQRSRRISDRLRLNGRLRLRRSGPRQGRTDRGGYRIKV